MSIPNKTVCLCINGDDSDDINDNNNFIQDMGKYTCTAGKEPEIQTGSYLDVEGRNLFLSSTKLEFLQL